MPARSRYGCVDPRRPEAAAVCGRGGEVVRRSELIEQTRWAGARLVGTGLLVCRRHFDQPQAQDRTLVLPPDPVPVRDPRPPLPGISVLPDGAITDEFGAPLLTENDEILEL